MLQLFPHKTGTYIYIEDWILLNGNQTWAKCVHNKMNKSN